jgi:membrane protein DedA with SNARE-associated domain
MKRFFQVVHLWHAFVWVVIVSVVGYMFFSQNDWRVGLICAVVMAFFIGGGVLLYRLMFRKKRAAARRAKAAPVAPATGDVIQQARNRAR